MQREFNVHRLLQTGAELGKLVRVKPTYQMIQQMLTSPVYAGMFVYGRRKLEMTSGDPPVMAERRRPVKEWDITILDVYPAYLSYDHYFRNRQQLRNNMDIFTKKERGAPRDGRASNWFSSLLSTRDSTSSSDALPGRGTRPAPARSDAAHRLLLALISVSNHAKSRRIQHPRTGLITALREGGAVHR